MKIKSPLKWKGKPKPVVYRGSRRIDSTCCSHGSCSWCKGNRFHSSKKREIEADLEIEEFSRGEK